MPGTLTFTGKIPQQQLVSSMSGSALDEPGLQSQQESSDTMTELQLSGQQYSNSSSISNNNNKNPLWPYSQNMNGLGEAYTPAGSLVRPKSDERISVRSFVRRRGVYEPAELEGLDESALDGQSMLSNEQHEQNLGFMKLGQPRDFQHDIQHPLATSNEATNYNLDNSFQLQHQQPDSLSSTLTLTPNQSKRRAPIVGSRSMNQLNRIQQTLLRQQQLRASIAAGLDEDLDTLWSPSAAAAVAEAAKANHSHQHRHRELSGTMMNDIHANDIHDIMRSSSAIDFGAQQTQLTSRKHSRMNLNNLANSQTHLSIADTMCGTDFDENGDGNSSEDEIALAKRDINMEHEAKTGFELAWLKLRYSVAPNVFEDPRWARINSVFHKHPRTILKGISGGLRSGQMVALMGPSGAGKTCLLECIAGIRRTGQEGRLCVRGRKRAQLVIVPQYDNLLPEFTVEELITYGSRMKNARQSNHAAIVANVIEQLGLKGCRRTYVKKCSGGQQKRVAIAQELVSKPNILILDEPTSGLDSSICYQTMKVLRQVLENAAKSDEPMAIVTTIHQPSAKVFKLFDLVYVLGKTGHFTYSGSPERMASSLHEVTGLECPKFSNPADYIIELVSYDYGHEPVELLIEHELKKGSQFEVDFEARSNDIKKSSRNLWKANSMMSLARKSITSRKSKSSRKEETKNKTNKQQQLQKSNESSSAGISMKELKPKRDRSGHFERPYVTYKQNEVHDLREATSNEAAKYPFLWHLYLHCHRSILQSIRDPMLNRMRVIFHIGFAVLVSVLFGREGAKARGCPPVMGLPPEITNPDNEQLVDLSDNVGFLYMCMMLITYVSLMTMTLTFPLEIKSVAVEYRNGWYGVSSFFFGKTIGDIPFILVYPIVYCALVWWATGQVTDYAWRPINFTTLIVLLALNSQTLGLIMGATFVNSLTAATFLGPVSTIPWYLLSGFPKRISGLPRPLQRISKYLFTRHIFEGLLVSIFGHERCNCTRWVAEYHRLRDEETQRLSRLVSGESLLALDYYEDLDKMKSFEYKMAAAGGSPNVVNMHGNALAELTKASEPPTSEDVWDRWKQPDLFSIMESNKKADDLFGFGLDFEPVCPANYTSYILNEFHLDENTLRNSIIGATITLICLRLLTYSIVVFKIRTRELG